MTEDLSPITPPPELVKEWMRFNNIDIAPLYLAQTLATQAARWGSDQELEACCEWLKGTAHIGIDFELINARRPKPPSLKEQGIALIDKIQGNKEMWDIRDLDVVRRALESLPN